MTLLSKIIKAETLEQVNSLYVDWLNSESVKVQESEIVVISSNEYAIRLVYIKTT